PATNALLAQDGVTTMLMIPMIATVSMVSVPMAVELDFSKIPPANSVPAYTMQLKIEFMSGQRDTIPFWFASEAEPSDVQLCFALAMHGPKWMVKSRGSSVF